jgi:hypothetical protein
MPSGELMVYPRLWPSLTLRPDNDIIIAVARRQWQVEFHPECEVWAEKLDQADAEALLAAIRVLRDQGPALGRPLADTVVASRHANMKELRPGSTGRSEIRVLFAFDTERQAILLVGGDKSGDWAGWYARNIPVADARFDEHQATVSAQAASGRQRGSRRDGKSTSRGKR